ncbi:glycine betaine ABC transporter substrate-binding protein [Atopococcus tabaci]|uniref:glycine betaine ABC transporter substrate-binding protein n=1 Tax=Atopococcus tabaci TaxID=269774 RepID=UPI00240A4EBD|nr:glycine betaine ABC transporter substrate-binding protein [Atopococcus tabaci]
MKNNKKLGATLGLSAILLLAACGNGEQIGNSTNDTQTISEAVDYTIVGIEPGAGITQATDNMLKTYENLAGWEQETSSTAGMLTQLDQAIRNEKPILITGWSPHYKFTQHDLKYLEDPEGAMGGEESLHTIARKGFKEEMPNAYQILDNFYWEVEDMETVMYEALDSSIEEAATNWVENNQETVDGWLEGTEKVDGEQIEIVSLPWDTERASSAVASIALEQQGYEVSITDVDVAVMFEAIANGEGDVSLGAWLPVTHGSFFENNEEDIEDLGPNLDGARLGIVVPEYMDIDSIEDLEPKE